MFRSMSLAVMLVLVVEIIDGLRHRSRVIQLSRTWCLISLPFVLFQLPKTFSAGMLFTDI